MPEEEFKVVRVWREARSSHFELLRGMAPGILLYRKTNYSFDASLAEGLRIRRLGVLRTCVAITNRNVEAVELNEPTMVRAWGELLVYHLVIRANRMLRPSRRPRVVLFAIDNGDVLGEIARRVPPIAAPFAREVARLVIGFQLRTFDRIVFGTSGAHHAYEELGLRTSAEIEVFEEISNVCQCVNRWNLAKADQPREVLFVGSFEERKGVRQLMAAWDALPQWVGGTLRLRLVGTGPLESEVRVWSGAREDVDLEIDPVRSAVHDRYRRARVVVLLSQRQGAWREQVGLPLLEGLAHGCVVVATSETGIAAWLSSHGHEVLQPDADPVTIGAGILRALEVSECMDVLADLPADHVRSRADRWLMNGVS